MASYERDDTSADSPPTSPAESPLYSPDDTDDVPMTVARFEWWLEPLVRNTRIPLDAAVDRKQMEEMACAICQDVPLDPLQTTCRHIFCSPCLEDWSATLRHSLDANACPVCKYAPMGPVTRLPCCISNIIQCHTAVKCPHPDCHWTGRGATELIKHRGACKVFEADELRPVVYHLKNSVHFLETELEDKDRITCATREDNDYLKSRTQSLETELEEERGKNIGACMDRDDANYRSAILLGELREQREIEQELRTKLADIQTVLGGVQGRRLGLSPEPSTAAPAVKRFRPSQQ